MLRQTDFQTSMLVLTAWRHGAEFGGHQSTLLIMNTIMNRVKRGWGDLFDVISSIPKYSSTIEQPNSNKLPSIWEPGFVKALHEVEGIMAGSALDISKGCLYWADLSKPVTNPFFQDKILNDKENHPPIVTMQTLYLFK